MAKTNIRTTDMYLYPEHQVAPDRYKSIFDEPPFNLNDPFYLNGATGTGKTYYSWCLTNTLNRVDWRKVQEQYGRPLGTDEVRHIPTYHFVVNVPAIMIEYRGSAFGDKTSLVDGLSRYNIIFDDMGAEYQSEFTQEFIHAILDARWDKKLWTSFTSNLKIGELPYGDRVKSRILGMVGENLHKLGGKDRRLSLTKPE